MFNKFIKWIRIHYDRIINSIAFYPALIAIGFLVLSYIMLKLDFSDVGKSLKSQWSFSLKDAETARTIAGTIAAGILSLAVFSFSMVMILLNQVASYMSNRVLDRLIGNRFHQIVLGFYIGTIVYALFLLSTIRNVDSGLYVPTLSTYFLISLTIIDIFLFIYFIHYITQSVKYETIIQHIHHETKESLKKYCTAHAPIPVPMQPSGATYELLAEDSGYFQNFEEDALLHLCDEENWLLFFKQPSGTFILKGVPVLIIQNTTQISEEQHQKLMLLINFYPGQPFDDNPYNGFRQLTEIALKALSPGINDPGTAILSLHSMMDLLAFRLNNYPDPVIKNKAGIPRIIKKEPTFVAVFETYVLPIWDYGKEDRMLRKELYNLLMQLRTCTNEHVNLEPIISLMEKVAEKRAKVAEHF